MQDEPLIFACRALSVAPGLPPRGSTWRSSLRSTNETGKQQTMPRYIIERELPGAGKLSAAELKAIARKSCAVLDKLGPKIQAGNEATLAFGYSLRPLLRGRGRR